MEKYTQRNPKYKYVKLGTCNTTLWNDGCFVCSLSMLTNKYNPEEVNLLLRNNGGYSNGCMVNSKKAAEILELEYKGITKSKSESICIAETNHFASKGVPQHFFVFAPKGTVNDVCDMILDPLDNPCYWRENKYNIVSYRLFAENKPDTEFEDAFTLMRELGVYSEHTEKNTVITTNNLSVFISRLLKNINK